MVAEHHQEDTDHGDRGAMYRFGVDNYDKATGKVMSKSHDVQVKWQAQLPCWLTSGLQVDIRLPIDAVIDETYFYMEVDCRTWHSE